MDLNQIELSGNVVEKLYRKSLVNLNLKRQSIPVIFTGGNKKQILVGLNTADLAKKDKEVLNNLIAACKLSEEDIALVNFYHQQFTVSDALEQLNPARAILFDIKDPSLIHNNYQVFYKGQVAFVLSDGLEVLHKNIEMKKQLWQCLRQLFNV